MWHPNSFEPLQLCSFIADHIVQVRLVSFQRNAVCIMLLSVSVLMLLWERGCWGIYTSVWKWNQSITPAGLSLHKTSYSPSKASSIIETDKAVASEEAIQGEPSTCKTAAAHSSSWWRNHWPQRNRWSAEVCRLSNFASWDFLRAACLIMYLYILVYGFWRSRIAPGDLLTFDFFLSLMLVTH